MNFLILYKPSMIISRLFYFSLRSFILCNNADIPVYKNISLLRFYSCQYRSTKIISRNRKSFYLSFDVLYLNSLIINANISHGNI